MGKTRATKKTKKARKARESRKTPPEEIEPLGVGDAVSAYYLYSCGKRGEWCNATIKKVHHHSENGAEWATYDVEYNDGYTDDHLPDSKIRRRQPPENNGKEEDGDGEEEAAEKKRVTASTNRREERAAARKKRTARKAPAAAEKEGDSDPPTPKRSKSSNKPASTKSKAAVTPSPVQAPRDAPSWRAYDELLKGDEGELPKSGASLFFVDRFKDDSERNFHSSMDALMKESLFAHPFGVKGNESGDKEERSHYREQWKRYALLLSSYPKERLEAVHQEFRKDKALHADLLKGLTEEIAATRVGGKRFYLRALNCIFYDAFDRCHIPKPFLPRWKLVANPNWRRKNIYKKQLWAHSQFMSRAFAVLRTVAKHPITIGKKDRREIAPMSSWHTEGQELPAIKPLQRRGEVPPMNDQCANEEKAIDFAIDWTKPKKKAAEIWAVWSPKKCAEKGKGQTDEVPVDNWESPVCSCKDCKETFSAEKSRKLEWDEKYKEEDKEKGDGKDSKDAAKTTSEVI